MRAPDTVTLYLQPEEGVWQTTVLEGVFLEEVRAAAVRGDGAEDAGSTRLVVPFAVKARDPDTGQARQYLPPAEYGTAADRTAFFTLRPGGVHGTADSFFVRGACEDRPETARLRPDAHRICRVRIQDRGSRALRHWTVTAV